MARQRISGPAAWTSTPAATAAGWLGSTRRAGSRRRTTRPHGSPPERVAGYIAVLGRLNAPRTVLNRVTDLATVLGWLAPEHDGSWLRRVLARLHARGACPARDKRRAAQRPRAAGPGQGAVMDTAIADDGKAPALLTSRQRARTRAAFGQPINPHLFRYAAAATIAWTARSR
jgi:hypothetical protein